MSDDFTTVWQASQPPAVDNTLHAPCRMETLAEESGLTVHWVWVVALRVECTARCERDSMMDGTHRNRACLNIVARSPDYLFQAMPGESIADLDAALAEAATTKRTRGRPQSVKEESTARHSPAARGVHGYALQSVKRKLSDAL
jgi:hypothetical protein